MHVFAGFPPSDREKRDGERPIDDGRRDSPPPRGNSPIVQCGRIDLERKSAEYAPILPCDDIGRERKDGKRTINGDRRDSTATANNVQSTRSQNDRDGVVPQLVGLQATAFGVTLTQPPPPPPMGATAETHGFAVGSAFTQNDL